uniref:hypothetical protein n=1 Tax=Bacteroides sp. TaxID=29523 RepID=UPI003AAD0A01
IWIIKKLVVILYCIKRLLNSFLLLSGFGVLPPWCGCVALLITAFDWMKSVYKLIKLNGGRIMGNIYRLFNGVWNMGVD